MLFVSVRVEEYIASSRDKFIIDPDPNQIYTKRKVRECSISLMFQGVDRPNTTPIGQDRKFKDLRALLLRVHLSKTSLFHMK